MGQDGNVYELLESAFTAPNDSPSENRAYRSGSWVNTEILLRASFRLSNAPTFSFSSIGFRVASVPEPSSTVLMCSASLLALARRRRRAAL